jgi:hypothetical protein
MEKLRKHKYIKLNGKNTELNNGEKTASNHGKNFL